MQTPETPAPARFETVVPVALEASAAVTSEHASTLRISVGLGVGVGEGLTDEVEGPDDPQALTKRAAVATRAITPLAEMAPITADLLCAPARLTWGP